MFFKDNLKKQDHGYSKDISSSSYFRINNNDGINNKKLPPECTACKRRFRSYDSWRFHRLSKHNIRPYTCTFCGHKFIHKQELLHHVTLHKDGYQCILCTTKFHRANRLTIHMSTHTQLKPCLTCCKKFTQRSQLISHSMGHLSLKPYRCTICRRRFAKLCRYTKHMQSSHDTIKKFICTTCGERFSSRISTWKHMRYAHRRIKISDVSVTTYENDYVVKESPLIKPGQYYCDVCKKNLSTSLTLKKHIKTTASCQTCHIKFCLGGLKRHMKNVHGIRTHEPGKSSGKSSKKIRTHEPGKSSGKSSKKIRTHEPGKSSGKSF